MPIIGDNASFFSASVIVGPIEIGNNVSVGANAVVTKDFSSNVVLAGMPARVVRTVEIKM